VLPRLHELPDAGQLAKDLQQAQGHLSSASSDQPQLQARQARLLRVRVARLKRYQMVDDPSRMTA
jgi:hypothetical protein